MNEKWMFLSMDEVEKKLNTSAASGLTRKAARGRLQKAGKNAFFLFSDVTPIDCIREVVTQPSVVLLVLLAGLLIMFQQPAQGKILLVLTALYVSLLIALRMWSGKMLQIPTRVALPTIRTIREGQLFLLSSTSLVPGDLIELECGDIAPCDLRIVSAQDLCVLTYLGTLKGEDRLVRTLKREDGISVSVDQSDITMHHNMLYGGSVIEHGRVKAIVVETGRHTYIGALQGGYPLKNGQSLSDNTLKMKKTASYLQIALLLAAIPMLCLCLLIGKTEEGLPMLFSTILCLCLANLIGNMETFLRFGIAVGIYRGISSHGYDEFALLKTAKNPDRFTDVDVLCMFGTQAFSESVAVDRHTEGLPVSPKEQNHDTRRQEMKLVLGDHFLSTAGELSDQLRTAGIRPVLFLEDSSPQTVRYILRTGIASSVKDIATAEQFRAAQRPITFHWGKYSAYCGFSDRELKDLFAFLRKNKMKIAVLGNTPREYAVTDIEDIRFACIDDVAEFTVSAKCREKNAKITRGLEDVATRRIRQQADVLIPCADRRHGGLAAIVHAFRTVSNLQRNLNSMIGYLIFTQVVRMILTLPTMVVGIHMVLPIQTALSGLGMDFLLALLLLTRVENNDLLYTRDRASSYSWKITICEAVFSGLLTLTAFLFIYYNTPDSTSATSSLFISLLLIQFTAFLQRWRPVSAIRSGRNLKNLIIATGCFLLFWGGAWAFRTMKYFGFLIVSAPYSYLLLIAPLSVVLVAIVIRLYRLGHSGS